MAKKKNDSQINLLPQEEFDASTLGRTLKWLLGTFRYLVILTEMVVMAAFLSRFWLDAKSNDLIDAINQKKAVVSSFSTFEQRYRGIQNELKIFKIYSSPNLILSPVVGLISSNVPPNIVLTEIMVDGSKVTISGQAADEASAQGFVANLSASNTLKNVGITSLESKQNVGALVFKIGANLAERSVASGQ